MAIKNKSSGPAKKSKAKTKAKNSAGFAAAFSALQKMLEPYEKSFQRIPGRSDRYWLETKCAAYKGRPFYFAGVSTRRFRALRGSTIRNNLTATINGVRK
jgi:hypothetical protein